MTSSPRLPVPARLLSRVTLSDLPAGWALGAIAGLVATCWAVTMLLGGAGPVAPHWFYLPVFLAGLRFGPVGALVCGGVVTVVGGPLLPLDAATHTPQATSDWVSRGIFFILIPQFVTQLFGAVRRMSADQARLVERGRVREAQAGALRESEARFRALVQRATDMIVVVSPEGRAVYESSAVERILGWDPGRRLSRPVLDFTHPEDRERVADVLKDVLEGPGASCTVEVRTSDSEGRWHWVESTFTNVLDEPTVHGIVINSRLIDERKALESELTRRALHDSLTGLANRALLRERLDGALARRERGVRRPALLFIDVDDFKVVNDGFGHAAGDRLLIEISRRLRASVRPEDLVARLGGDEFAVLIEEPAGRSDAAIDVAERIIAAFEQPFDVSRRPTRVAVSIGIASYNGGAPDTDLILRHADVAMYHAKANGKAQHATFTDSMHELLRHRLDLESGLRGALERDQIQVVYQPIVSLGEREIEAVEALARWEHPTRGLVPPADFLDVAEETGLIVPVGRRVLQDACRQVRRWRQVKPELKVSVNLSPAELQVASIVEDVAAAVADAGVHPSALVLEVTEGTLITDLTGLAATLESLRSLGVRIAIDDFGTGYSSLSHLQRLSVDMIKIDKTFIDRTSMGPAQANLARAVLAIGQEFCLPVIAEGVETEAQDDALRRLGCKYGQGYLYGRPGAAGHIDELLALGALPRPRAAAVADRTAPAVGPKA